MSSPERRESRPEDARPAEAAHPIDDGFPSPQDGDVPPPAVPLTPAPEPRGGDEDDADLLAALDDEALAAAEALDRRPRWDADDPRRRKDCFAPPADPCECHCLHCGRTFSSDGIWFQRVINDPQGFEGFWMCPTPNCSGAGFTFDIFPTDPDHPANEGWHDDDGDGDEEDFDGDESDLDAADTAWAAEFTAEDAAGSPEEEAEYDPAEPKYKNLDDLFGADGDDDDLEGEEWKYGLQPGERPAANPLADEAERQAAREEEMYDEPDQRPRVLDWSQREDRKPPSGDGGFAGGGFTDDDIPF
ncbi:MAG TPA: hypothetical protein VF796_05610 [Humisphaera sp.]